MSALDCELDHERQSKKLRLERKFVCCICVNEPCCESIFDHVAEEDFDLPDSPLCDSCLETYYNDYLDWPELALLKLEQAQWASKVVKVLLTPEIFKVFDEVYWRIFCNLYHWYVDFTSSDFATFLEGVDPNECYPLNILEGNESLEFGFTFSGLRHINDLIDDVAYVSKETGLLIVEDSGKIAKKEWSDALKQNPTPFLEVSLTDFVDKDFGDAGYLTLGDFAKYMPILKRDPYDFFKSLCFAHSLFKRDKNSAPYKALEKEINEAVREHKKSK